MRLRTRLIVTSACVLLVVSSAMAWALPRVSERVLLNYTATAMARQVELLVSTRLTPSRMLDLLGLGPQGLPGEESDRPGSATNLLVVDADNQVVYPAALRRTALGRNLPVGLGQLADRARATGRGQGVSLRESGWVAGAAPTGAQGQAPGAGQGRGGNVLILLQPLADLQPAIRNLQRQIVIWTLAGLALAIALGAIIAGAVTRRLGHLRAAAIAIAGGNLSQRAPEAGRDEVAEVARAFNVMANQLQQTVSGLRESEQLRRDLVATLAHELRTPVTSIQGFAEALRDGVVKDPDQGRQYLGIIVDESQRLTRLVKDLFDFATLAAGKVDFFLHPLAVVPWLRDHAAGLAVRVAAAGHTLQVELPPEARDLVVQADRDRLGQVIGNLIDNALRHSPPGRAITLALDCPSPAALRISVCDQGSGVPPQERQRIWDRFYRGASGGGGAGLGLAIVKAIVTAHGGEVGVDDQPGSGARFWFTLPVVAG